MSYHAPFPVAHDHPPHPLRDLAQRLDAVWLPLLALVARLAHRLAQHAPLAALRLQRAHARLRSILERCAAGTYPARRRRVPAEAKRTPTPSPHLPRRRAWLAAALDHNARGLASQLTHLLADPATAAILARAPAHARAAFFRALVGPARLLGIDIPPQFQFPGPPRPLRRRVPPPRAPRPTPPPAPPLPRNILRAARYFRQKFGRED
jgi:hypothetical protein